MAFPCCMGLTTGVRLAAILSILLAIGLGMVSGWLLKDTHDVRESNAGKFLNAVDDVWNSAFGSVKKIDLDKVLRIKLACSGSAFAGAVLQLFTSILLLCCSSAKSGRSSAKLYIVINTLVLIAVAGAVACFLTAEQVNYKGDTKDERQVQYFMAACAIDFVFLIYLLMVAGAYSRS